MIVITIEECHVTHHSVLSSITISTVLLEAHVAEIDLCHIGDAEQFQTTMKSSNVPE